MCVCSRCSSSYSSWRSLITGVSLLSSRTDSMLQRYWLIGVNGISTLFRLAPWGLVSKPFFFFFQVAALREAPLHWAYSSIPYPPLWNSPPVYSSPAREREWRVRASIVQRGIMSSQLGPALINLPCVFSASKTKLTSWMRQKQHGRQQGRGRAVSAWLRVHSGWDSQCSVREECRHAH